MSSDLVPSGGNTPAPTDGDNKYKSGQHKLKLLATALDGALERLQRLQRNVSTDAGTSEGLARDIAHAEFDKKFIEAQNAVSVPLGGAVIDARNLAAKTRETAADAWAARSLHALRYGPLDAVRSGRPERTPKPGVFERRGG
ncbi:conjugal transfer protein TraB [Streptomyces sp. NPDC017964]|uniref:conjugal transfer protein TraB n=1 Tax=Streptomyces sp. NPDC017964 TaxID=3365022 RepID=UPI0037AC0A50